jgi:hypothetical protein
VAVLEVLLTGGLAPVGGIFGKFLISFNLSRFFMGADSADADDTCTDDGGNRVLL